MNLKNSNNYIEYIFNIKNKEIIKLLNYDKKFLFDKNEEIGEYFDIYIEKINFCTQYNIKKLVNMKLKLIVKNKYIMKDIIYII